MFENLKEYNKEEYPNSIKIGLFIKEGSVSADIRLLTIFNILSSDKNYSTHVIYGKDMPNVERDLLNNDFTFDYVVVQRNALDQNNVNSNLFYLLVEKCQLKDIKIIFEIDDDLLNMPKSNPGYPYYNRLKSDMEYLIRNSYAVTVSTNQLKVSYSYLNDNIFVIPNRLIDEWFKGDINRTNDSNIIKIGYMGTVYHSWDLILIEKAINNVKKYFKKVHDKDVSFELVGGTDEDLSWVEKIDVPQENQRYLNFIPWLKEISNWDIVVAPLEESVLNANKSELKYLEYTGLGLAGVYSNMGPYKENISHEYNGLIVKSNSSEEWEKNIIRLIEDGNLRNNIIKNAKKDIMDNYLIKDSVIQWKNILAIDNLYFKRLDSLNLDISVKFKKNYLNRLDKLKILNVTFNNKIDKIIFQEKNWSFFNLSMSENLNQDIFVEDIYDWGNQYDNCFDIVIVSNLFEYLDYFWLAMIQIEKVLKPEGYICIFSSDINCEYDLNIFGIESLLKFVNLNILESSTNNFDDFSVFSVFAQKSK